MTLGTISYMSPEQASGEQLDGRTDIFSLGVVLYECATGRHPFPGKTTAVTLAAILNKPPLAPVSLNPELPLRLQEVITNCLEKDRELRYQSAADLRADLKRVRRDLESGHAAGCDVGEPASTRALSAALSSASRGGASASSVPTPPAATRHRRRSRCRRIRRRRRPSATSKWIAIGAVVVAWPPSRRCTRRARSAGQPIRRSLRRCRTPPFRAGSSWPRPAWPRRNYRAAAAYAAEVLAVDAGQRRSREDSRRGADDARRASTSRSRMRVRSSRTAIVQGAARALETARVLDPTSPSVVELAAQMADLARAARRRDASAPGGSPAGRSAAAGARNVPLPPSPPAAPAAAPRPRPHPRQHRPPPRRHAVRPAPPAARRCPRRRRLPRRLNRARRRRDPSGRHA